MSGHQRNTWGIRFQKDSPKPSYNMNPPPPCLTQNTRAQYDNIFGTTAQSFGGVARSYSTLGKRRIKDEDEYFNEEEETKSNNDLEYIPAPNSPSAIRNNEERSQIDSDGSEDPLDAYMNEIDNEIERQKKGVSTNKTSIRGERYDIEREDEIESYIKYMDQQASSQHGDDDDIVYEYDEDGNIINKEKRAVEPLPPTDHSAINYQQFERNFYNELPDIAALTPDKVVDLQRKLGISVRGPAPPKPVCSFAHFGFDDKLMTIIRKSKFTTPTPIQAQAIPAALSGRDVIGIAKTGSGKTAAFLWPMLVHIMDQPELQLGDGPIGLVCAPTRELAQQIHQEALKYGRAYNIQSVCAFGGGSMYEQQKACEAGCEILVCTPGRLIDLVKKKATNLRRVTYLVFDEADKMFNLGFEAQVKSIAKNVRPDRQTLLFSATFKSKVERLAREALTEPIRIVQGHAGDANEDVTQIVQVLPKEQDKWPWLLQTIVQFASLGSVLVFTTRKITSVDVAQRLTDAGHQCLLIHGDVHQLDRNKIIGTFKRGDCRILVATDVASRGLDIPVIRTVINYDVAKDIDTHTHRIGRTGRAGQKGSAYTLVTREKDREFAGHLVRNLEGASQLVPQELLELAQQSQWFNKARNSAVIGGGGKKMGANLGVRMRPGLGSASVAGADSTSLSDSPPPPVMTQATTSSSSRGPQTDRLSTMRAAFNAQYQRMFVSAGVEGTCYTHPLRLGEAPPAQVDSQSANDDGQKSDKSKRKKSRWD